MLMKIYISGKISGIEDIAYNNFEKAEKEISQMDDNIFFNIQIINPMKLPHLHTRTWEKYMVEDLKALLECDTIYMLKNWNESKGATIERQLALQLGFNIIYQQ